jgi:hypothetical protein
MTAKRKFPAVDEPAETGAQISKADEVAWLAEAAASLPEQSYLKSLFSTRLIEWFRIQTTSDMNTDLVAVLDFSERQRGQDAQAAQTELRRVVAQAEAEKREVEALRMQVRERDAHVAELIAARTEAYAEIDFRDAEYLKLTIERNALCDELSDAKIAVRDLKAQLFDLYTAQGTLPKRQ